MFSCSFQRLSVLNNSPSTLCLCFISSLYYLYFKLEVSKQLFYFVVQKMMAGKKSINSCYRFIFLKRNFEDNLIVNCPNPHQRPQNNLFSVNSILSLNFILYCAFPFHLLNYFFSFFKKYIYKKKNPLKDANK